MLAAAVATWQQSVSKNCKEVGYEAAANETGSGCGKGPIGKRIYSAIGPDSEAPPPETCRYAANLCSGPDHITVVLGTLSDPYANHVDIGVSFTIGDARVVEFICNIATEVLTELAMAVAPELAGPEAFKEFEFESMCQRLGQAIGA